MATENIVVNITANAESLKPTIDLLVKMGQISAKDAEEFKKLTAETTKLAQESKKAATEAAQMTDNLPGGKRNPKPSVETQKTTQGIGSLRAEIIKAKQEALALAQQFGQFSPQAIEAAKRAAVLVDRMNDLNKTVQALDPEAKLTAFVRLGGGIAGAFTAAQGAMALFGEESEDVQQAILKVQGALALTQGLNSVLQLKDSFRDLRILLGVTTTAQTAFTAATTTGTVATNIFATAQQRLSAIFLASPLAPVILAVGALTGAILLLKDATDAEAESQERLNQLTEEYEQSLKDLETEATTIRAKVVGELNRQIELLQAQGNKEIEIFELRKSAIIAELRELARLNGIRGSLTNDELERQKDLRNKIEILEIERTNFIKREYEKRADEIEKINDRIFKAQLTANELLATSDENLIERRLINLELELNRELTKVGNNEKEKLALVLEFGNRRTELEKQLSAIRLQNANKAASEERQRLSQLLEQQFNELEIQLRQSGLETGELNKALKELDISKLEALVVAAEAAGEDTSNLRLQIERLKNSLKDVPAPKLPKEQIDKTKEAVKIIAAEAESLMFNIIDSIAAAFEANAQELEEFKDRQLAAIDEEAEALELANERKLISDGQLVQGQAALAKKRETTEKELNRKIAEEKRKAFIAERAASIIQTIISGAEGSVKISKLIPFPASIPFIAAYASLVAARIALIASQPIPKFAKGVVGLKGKGTGTSDSIPAMLSAGESVITAEKTAKFRPTLDAIHQNRISPEILNAVAVSHKFDPVEARLDPGKLTRNSRKLIPAQADAIGKAVAKYMKEENYYSPIRR